MLEIKGKDFLLNGKKFNIYSGAMHYFRILPEYWEDRLVKLKLSGLNTVETYISWADHEPNEGEYCFEGRFDIIKFIEIAKKLGLYVIIRPGPYICAEYDFGGFPAWLLNDETLKLRCYNEKYLSYVKKYFEELLPKFAPLQISKGGNIIAMQIENEYGSYGNDKKYLAFLRDLIRGCGIDVLLFTSDGEGRYHLSGGALTDEYKVVNFGCFPNEGFKDLKILEPNKPLMCGEFWCGWFDHWGKKHPLTNSFASGKALNEFFACDANFNLYMFHGGTNFGFSAGANYHERYYPTTTSYDYNAPLNEWGDYTPKYHKMRELLLKKQNLPASPLPPSPKLQKIGKVDLKEVALLMDNIKVLGEKHIEHFPKYMEYFRQKSGYILYHTEIEGNYPETSIAATGVHDIAYVFVNDKFIGKIDRTIADKNKQFSEMFDFKIPAFCGKIVVDILVEGMGRINFGKGIYDRKGLATIMIGEQLHFGYEIYTLPMDDLSGMEFTKIGSENKGEPRFLRGNFKASSKNDCFLDMQGFSKGCVFINGFNLGRYWNIGPQRTLYLPGVLLKEENEIIILEQEKNEVNFVNIIDKPIFAKYNKKPNNFIKLFNKFTMK